MVENVENLKMQIMDAIAGISLRTMPTKPTTSFASDNGTNTIFPYKRMLLWRGGHLGEVTSYSGEVVAKEV